MKRVNQSIAVLKPKQPRQKKGIALITVLAFLSIFAIIMVSFVFSIRIEEVTTQNYSESINIEQASEAAIQAVLSQVARDLDPSKPNVLLGRPQPRYISLLDPWAVGYSGKAGPLVLYDARSHQVDIRPERQFRRSGIQVYPTPIPLGVDEDPNGDVTGYQRIVPSNRQGRGDGYPGLAFIDDDQDGLVDNDGDTSLADDDDEDFLLNEDPLDQRRADAGGSGFFFPAGTGYDQDGDRLGVTDESAKLNINFAGNNNSAAGQFTYHLGVGPAELDLPVYIYGRVTSVNEQGAQQIASQIVNFRNGSTNDGGESLAKPGADNADDNGNNSPQIFEVIEFSQAYRTGTFDGEPFTIAGNSRDDDGDGFLNEEDERYIGPSTENQSGTPLTDGIISTDNGEDFRMGDKVDNDGDGKIDEQNEGVDEPSEFNVFKPRGDDRPYTSTEDLKLLAIIPDNDPPFRVGAPPSLFEILRTSTTIYSQSDQISGPLSGKNNEIAKINPNLISNWRASDVWETGDAISNRADFQYSSTMKVEDLLPAFQVDNDGDWQMFAEPDVMNGQADGIDNDGDGLVDESSDDWDGNFYASGDFDGFSEADVGSIAIANSIDDDGDGQSRDENRPGVDVIRRKRVLGTDAVNDEPARPRDEREIEIRMGMVAEGDGADNDGDNVIDDDGDFNGDGLITYDPEWHVNEDDVGDLSGDGYPGLGGNPEMRDEDNAEGDIVKRPVIADDLLITNFADDDFDGFADFNDPQVLAAMYAPELDSVDNDGDGIVDEIGERYIAAFDDDEDGRMDEDPAEFQLALNMIDYIDSWGPYKVAQDENVRDILGVNNRDPVIADPVTIRTFNLYSSRQRAFRFHPRILAGANANSSDQQEFTEQMRLLLPNPPQIGVPVRYEGVEAIRINEVMPKPVIRLEAEEVLTSINYDSNTQTTTITPDNDKFEIINGDRDNGGRTDLQRYDSNWGPAAAPVQGSVFQNIVPGFDYKPDGFRHTLNTAMPFVNMDAIAPAFIFGVTNIQTPPQGTTTPDIGKDEEIAEWTFENLPAGLYDAVIYMHPNHGYRPEVRYILNGEEISFKSDFAFGEVGQFVNGAETPAEQERIYRDTATLPSGVKFPLPYRLTAFPVPAQDDVTDTGQRVEIGQNGTLTLRIIAEQPLAGYQLYGTSFDRIELFNPRAQYVELVNISTDDVDLSGWQVNTPYGHYILPNNTVIGGMKPKFRDDDGDDLPENEGIPGDGVPFEQLLTVDKIREGNFDNDDRRLEDNKLLLAFDRESLIEFIQNNYPDVDDLDDRVVEPIMGNSERQIIEDSIDAGQAAAALRNSQISDTRFRLVDMQTDVLAHNPAEKHVTLYDPAGHYIDSFPYKTTFNNVVLGFPPSFLNLVALPGYRGFETYERADPTHFETEISVNEDGSLIGKRVVPSSIKLDAIDARVVNIGFDNGEPVFGHTGGYGDQQDPNNTGVTRFRDSTSEPPSDSQWNGWDFIGDWYTYPEDRNGLDLPRRQSTTIAFERFNAMAREAVAPSLLDERVRFFSMLGGFENMTDFRTPAIPGNPTRAEIDEAERAARLNAPVTAFVWRMGLRELVRAGYDPEVDDILTMRAIGRQLDLNGLLVDLPVGEVLTNPVVRVVNPGDGANNTVDNVLHNIQVNGDDVPVFAKLRNGDTFGSVDLRTDFLSLTRDLRNPNQDEPMIEIMVFMRKTTRDHSPTTQSVVNGTQLGSFTTFDRPELALLISGASGAVIVPSQRGEVDNALLMDDNYFFKGIELFGRGRADDEDSEEAYAKSVFLAGTPGRDNTGYVPAYPRRRYQLGRSQRDEYDIIDNTAYVKNGLLATVGEVSRLFTGNKFETVNMPRIPQWVEDRTTDPNRSESNARLGVRAGGNDPEFRIRLAQREQLDQWENQYTNIYNSFTTFESVIVPGLVNINTAPRELLAALPSAPHVQPGQLDSLQRRYRFNTIVADFIIEGRLPGGHDGFFGVHEIDDDQPFSAFNRRTTNPDSAADFKLPSIGRLPRAFNDFDDIRQMIIDPLNIRPENIQENQIDWSNVYNTTIVSMPDDGPYANLGDLLSQITHLKRRERFSTSLSRLQDRTNDVQPDGIGDLRERLNEQLSGYELTPEDMEALMNRISNLITVRSRAFGITSRGRILDRNGAIVSQRKLETVFNR